jgi:hypothetical protein
MNPRRVAFGSLVALAGISASIWLARYGPWAEQRHPEPSPVVLRLQQMKEGAARRSGVKPEADEADGIATVDPSIESRPAVASDAPFPQAVIGERSYDFGHMETHQTKSHLFRIENKGRAPLVLAKGPTECKCTISNLTTHEIPPGGLAEVEVAWTPHDVEPFEKSAIIWTNDPNLSEVHFRIAGKVGRAVAVSPTAWHAGLVAEDRDGKAVGIVVSEVDAGFKILSVQPADPNVAVSYQPMTARALDRVKMVAGYEFTATVRKGIPIGNFRSHVRILTSLYPKTPIDVDLTAVRPGPIRFLSAVPIVGNARWNSEKAVLNLGRFRHELGCKIALPAFVSDMTGKFEVLRVKSSDSFVKVSLEPNPNQQSGGQQGIRFVFEVPPGSPPVNYFTRKPAHITVQTNHPALKNLDFDLEFVSL